MARGFGAFSRHRSTGSCVKRRITWKSECACIHTSVCLCVYTYIYTYIHTYMYAVMLNTLVFLSPLSSMKIMTNSRNAYRIALRMVTRRNTEDASIRRKRSLLEEYSKNDALDVKDIVGMACDMLLAGMDTVSFKFHHRHREIQFYTLRSRRPIPRRSPCIISQGTRESKRS